MSGRSATKISSPVSASAASRIAISGLPASNAEIAPYPGGVEAAAQAGPTLAAQLGAGHGATVTLRRPE